MLNIKNHLQQLGISDKEIDVYLAILKLKKATVIQLSDATKIKRTTIYHCLETLIHKELVQKSVQDNKKYYLADDPKTGFNNLLQDQKTAINLVVPELKNIFGQGLGQPEIKIYYHTSGLQQMFSDVLNSTEKLARYYRSDTNLEDLLGDKFIEDFVKKRVKNGVKSLSLRPFGYRPKRKQKLPHNQELREVRFLPNEFSAKPFICVYDDKVTFISSMSNKGHKMGFMIQSQEFAHAQKEIFDLLWNKVAM